MKANELRIGNYYVDVCGSISEWKESSFQHYRLAKVKLSEIKPIPLTKEWLVKFDLSRVKLLIGIDIYVDGSAHLMSSGTLLASPIPCKYVHQLQNLYFSLTGEELNYHELHKDTKE